MNNRKAQEDELTALESIYGNLLEIDRSTEYPSGIFYAHPVLPDSYCVKFVEIDESGSKTVAPPFNIKYLPPITLHFQLHNAYPSRKNPAFLISCEWLGIQELESLCNHMEELWKNGNNEVILYLWIQFLEDGALSHLGIQNYLTIRSFISNSFGWHNNNFPTIRNIYDQNGQYSGRKQNKYIHQCSDYKNIQQKVCDQQAHSNSSDKHLNCRQTNNSASDDSLYTMQRKRNFFPSISRGYRMHDCRALSTMCKRREFLVRRLKGYNKRKMKEIFDSDWFSCDVCMEEKQGRCFMRLSVCQHLYCKDCLKTYFEIQINDGTVTSITCPKEKCSSQPLPSEIRELVGPDLYARYDKLLLTATLDTMADVMYCPRVFCQCPVMLEPDRSMAICPSCQFVFCIYCKMVYHGVASCKFKKEERKQIREEYLNSTKEEKELLEQRYGRRSLQMLVDETLSEEWLEDNSKRCPNCNSSIEKFEGCNKVTCWRCGSYFCWICMMKLKMTNPYSHFSDPNSPCYNQLFQGVEFSDDDDWEVGAFL